MELDCDSKYPEPQESPLLSTSFMGIVFVSLTGAGLVWRVTGSEESCLEVFLNRLDLPLTKVSFESKYFSNMVS